MRTSILVMRYARSEVYDRAVLSSDANPDEAEARIKKMTPVIWPTGWDRKYLRVYFSGASRMGRVRLGKVRIARVIPIEYVDELDQLDKQIDSLMLYRKRIQSEAWRRGRELSVKDIKKEGA